MQHRSQAERWRALGGAALILVGLLAPAAPAQEGGPETPPQEGPTPPAEEDPARGGEPDGPSPPDAEAPPHAAGVPRDRAGYDFLEDQGALLADWQRSQLLQRLELPVSAGGREVFAVQFGAPGPRPLEERTTLFLLGGLDGTSLAGSQAVIAAVDALLADVEHLPGDAAFVAVPWANPDGLARWRSRATGAGRNDRSVDEDGDGRVDEDGPDDLDRDGMILEMLMEDPAGPWVRALDPRFLRAAREGEAPRFVRLREGADDDGDGRYNEDGPGGVVLDRSFPLGWEDCRGRESGPWPLSEPDALGLAELLMGRRTAVVIAFQGNHGKLASPGGRALEGDALPFAEDQPTYRRLTEVFCAHTARLQARATSVAGARGEPWSGCLVDWAYAALGALSMEIGVWGPEVQAGPRGPVDAFYKDAAERAEVDPGASPAEEAWARWLDDTRGGSGFVDWQPVELPGSVAAWVGGWEPNTIANPPPDVLPQALRGLDAFVLDLARNLPRLEVELREAKREGKVCLVKARVKNLGTLPSGVGPGAPSSSVRVRLEITPGVTLRAGQLESVVGHLPGRGTSEEYGWLLVAPEGSLVRIVVESAWSPPLEREVRL
jgi:hypothetical protein